MSAFTIEYIPEKLLLVMTFAGMWDDQILAQFESEVERHLLRPEIRSGRCSALLILEDQTIQPADLVTRSQENSAHLFKNFAHLAMVAPGALRKLQAQRMQYHDRARWFRSRAEAELWLASADT